MPGLRGSYVTWSNSGRYLAYARNDGIVVSRPDWTVVSRTSMAGVSACPAAAPGGCRSVQAVSDDGRYVAVGLGNTGPGYIRQPLFVLDTRTGTTLPLPAGIGDLQRLYFQAGGGLVLQTVHDGTRIITLVGVDGKVIATRPDPDAQDLLVGYRP